MKLGKKPMYKPIDPYTGMRSTYNYTMRGGTYPPRYVLLKFLGLQSHFHSSSECFDAIFSKLAKNRMALKGIFSLKHSHLMRPKVLISTPY